MGVRARTSRSLLVVTFALTFGAGCIVGLTRRAQAQDSPGGAVVVDPTAGASPSADPLEVSADGTSTGAGHSITPLVAPVPFKNTQLGWGLALMLGAIHRFDPDTTLKPSTGALAGFYTENHSWGLMAMEMARLHHDDWRVRGILGHMSLRYDFYGIGEAAGEAGLSIPLQQELNIGYGSVVRRILPGLYLGPTLLWMRTHVDLREPPSTVQPLPGDTQTADLVAPGVEGEFDTRNDDYWPTSGSFGKLKVAFFTEALGSSRTFQRYTGAWSWYGRMPAPRLVLATNVNVMAAPGDAPFYALPSVGSGRFPLRGYTIGRYRDHVMAASQAELRYHFEGRFGVAVFGGFGLVAPDAAGIFNASVLPAGGVGLRYRLVRKFPLHMRLDDAWGRDENLIYFGVGEAF
jgi:hypothetical protein